MDNTYEIKLPQFEGPFDLLLFFIERDELDIYDIPIAKLTNDFLNYMHQMEQLDIELASEFILVAATLMRVKAKMLLPRKDMDELGNEIDPREELVQKLIEYKKYKAVVDELKEMEAQRSGKYKRGNLDSDIKQITKTVSDTETDLQTLTLYKLMTAFQKVLTRYENSQIETEHKIKRYPYTIDEEKEALINNLKIGDRQSFEVVFENCTNKVQGIFRFLALLELIQLREIKITIGEGMNNFWVETF